MSEIVLATLNAKYIHTAFGLRYLMANMGDLAPATSLLEFDINSRPTDIAETILSQSPRIVGLGVYIWNTAQTGALLRILKRVRPGLMIVLGGPEVSHETEGQDVVAEADYVICGEADLAFADLCRRILSGNAPQRKVMSAPLPDLEDIRLPYDLYTETDISHRVIYVEASRGCPFSCEFCLSSLDTQVRAFPQEAFLGEMDRLLARGARQLKFVDRTFNLKMETSLAILDFLHERFRPGLFLHFEVVPDRLPDSLMKSLARFPAGAVQLEAGVQTFNGEVAHRISRKQNYGQLEANLRGLRSETGAHIHADLIAGLPGEDMASFAAGFDRLVSLNPHEIQLGILKRLKGTPISRHHAEWEMVYSAEPPFEILQNRLLAFKDVQQLKRFARFWNLIANSGNFIETTPLIWSSPGASPFERFMELSQWLHNRLKRTDSIALPRLMEALHQWLSMEAETDSRLAAVSLWKDYQRAGRRELPEFLRPFGLDRPEANTINQRGIPRRQARHQGPG